MDCSTVPIPPLLTCTAFHPTSIHSSFVPRSPRHALVPGHRSQSSLQAAPLSAHGSRHPLQSSGISWTAGTSCSQAVPPLSCRDSSSCVYSRAKEGQRIDLTCPGSVLMHFACPAIVASLSLFHVHDPCSIVLSCSQNRKHHEQGQHLPLCPKQSVSGTGIQLAVWRCGRSTLCCFLLPAILVAGATTLGPAPQSVSIPGMCRLSRSVLSPRTCTVSPRGISYA